jgi:DNA-binding CsgD family transcriptional regulator
MHALLSPLDHAHVNDWRALVNRELCSLLGADSAGFLLPTLDASPMFSNEHSPAALAAFPELLPPALSDGTPIWQRMIALGTGTLDEMYGADMPTYLGSAYYNEYAAKGGGAETLASSILVSGSGHTPVGAASLHLWHSRLGRRRFGEREVTLLALLYPAFRAGVESWQRFGVARRTLLLMIDQLDQAVIVCDRDGRSVHETPCVTRMLSLDPQGATVRAAMMELARRLPTTLLEPGDAKVWKELRTPLARYTIHGCTYASSTYDAPLRLSSVKRNTPDARSVCDLRAEFGFTPAEAVVAQLIAQGLRNASIAASLGTSEHTVKRQTERVLRKLGVGSRTEVGPRIA